MSLGTFSEAVSEIKTTPDSMKSTCENIWLHYYNRVLYEKGIITEAQRNKMKLAIDAKKKSLLGE